MTAARLIDLGLTPVACAVVIALWVLRQATSAGESR